MDEVKFLCLQGSGEFVIGLLDWMTGWVSDEVTSDGVLVITAVVVEGF